LVRPDFRSQAQERLATERTERVPVLIDLLGPDDGGPVTEVRHLDVERISSNPNQPRQVFDPDALQDLAASIREHGILQPVLVRPRGDGQYQLIAGERRWRAARIAGMRQIPAIVEQIDDEGALEIAIIENLQREDISPLEEADMFDRMTSQHGYSLRKLAQKLGKDKGYIENRLRLADAPPEIRELVARRSDTLSAAYELMKVRDPRRRRRLAEQVATGELSLARLRQRIEPAAAPAPTDAEAIGPDALMSGEAGIEAPEATLMAEPAIEPVGEAASEAAFQAVLLELEAAAASSTAIEPEAVGATIDAEVSHAEQDVPGEGAEGPGPGPAVRAGAVDDAESAPLELNDVDVAARQLSHAVDDLVSALLGGSALSEASSADRQLFTKYLTVSKIKLENAIAVVRQGNSREPSVRREVR
jgi:ParB family transcriptional regulator, chromosome partitioning protein